MESCARYVKLSQIVRINNYFEAESWVRYFVHAAGLLKCQLIRLIERLSSATQITRSCPQNMWMRDSWPPKSRSIVQLQKQFSLFSPRFFGFWTHSALFRDSAQLCSQEKHGGLLSHYIMPSIYVPLFTITCSMLLSSVERKEFSFSASACLGSFSCSSRTESGKIRSGMEESFPSDAYSCSTLEWVMCTLQFREREWIILRSWLGLLWKSCHKVGLIWICFFRISQVLNFLKVVKFGHVQK